MSYSARMEKLRALMTAENLQFLYVTNMTNVRYLCGFNGSNGSLLVGSQETHFFSDGRYRTQAASQVEGADVNIYTTPTEQLAAVGQAGASGRIGIEAAHLTLRRSHISGDGKPGLTDIKGLFPDGEIVETDSWVESLRQVKDADELKSIAAAVELADRAFLHALERIELGRTEIDIALDLEIFLRRNGASGVSFEPIVATGANSALPHARPTSREVEKGDFVLLDFGCKVDGYCSDLTRTVIAGPSGDRQSEIYSVVLEANRAATHAARAGAKGIAVDSVARDIITKAGFGEAFLHGLGHGVGLEIHENPRLSKSSVDTLVVGNVVTIEPGIYLEGWGGVRIEDLVVVGDSNVDVLSKAPADLIVL